MGNSKSKKSRCICGGMCQIKVRPPPPSYWADFEEFVLEDHELQLFRGLCAVCPRSDHDKLAHWVFIFAFRERGMEFLQSLTKFELESRAAASVDGSRLFRSSIAAATIGCYGKLVGREYLSETLGPLIQKTILWSTEGLLEVDPAKIKPTNTLEKNQERFIMLVQEFLDAIFDSIDKFPLQISQVCLMVTKELEQVYPDVDPFYYVGYLCFVRFFCHAIVSPERYGLIDETLELVQRRGLILVSKVLQNFGVGVLFSKERKPLETYMIFMNEYHLKNQDSFKLFTKKVLKNQSDQIRSERNALREKEREEALHSAYLLLFVNKGDLPVELSEVILERLNPHFKALGVPLKKAVAVPGLEIENRASSIKGARVQEN